MNLNKSQQIRLKVSWQDRLVYDGIFNIKENISVGKDLYWFIFSVNNKARMRITYNKDHENFLFKTEESSVGDGQWSGFAFFSTTDTSSPLFCKKEELDEAFNSLRSKLTSIFEKALDLYYKGDEKVLVELNLFALSKECLQTIRKMDKAS